MKSHTVFNTFFVIIILAAHSGLNGPVLAQEKKAPRKTDVGGITFVSIPGDSFLMGTDDGEDDEKPARRITLGAYMIAETEVTQELYESIMSANPSKEKGDPKLPVETVTWYEAVRFCNMLSERHGLERCYDDSTWVGDLSKNGFRLPTEAEWEYACRAGTTTEYCTGDDESGLARAGWYGFDAGNSGGRPHPVAQKEPNARGLYDMHGNVWEWTNDWFGPYDETELLNPVGPDEATYKTLRGGSWFDEASYCRSAFRINDRPDRTGYFTGFRIARSVR